MFKVLIVEDDFMVADCLEEILLEAGFTVCGVAGNVAGAIALGEQCVPELAVVDLRLMDGEYGTEAGAVLSDRFNTGVLYATGNSEDSRLQNARGVACIAKPYSASAIVAALYLVNEKRRNTAASLNLPKGCRFLGA